ncbi:carbohydrate ABC transporter permease [Dactylosporangium siamense]|uniref:Sugar ABC transporter permease n=1 Tax=Dactylosporangium siamense TaxID=685454 RepID=A0A919PGA5_9ACTN|nr:carbohydrate ABC transporter permease [Dactylosporangium siamense]GIG43394.1 sugar ABC transporter permease [Dactylosporangium siamense]
MKPRFFTLPTAVLLIGALYCLLPIVWVVTAASKTNAELFHSFTLAPGTALLDNIGELSSYQSGMYWRWILNTALYAGVGALLSTAVSGLTGYTLAKYRFPGRSVVFNVLLAGVLVPAVVLAIPQYLLLAKFQLTDSYLSVLLPSVLSPYGIYLARIYAAAAVPDSLIEAARADGAGELRIFASIAAPSMVPGLVTVFLFQFVAIWNNFLLPFIMLTSDDRFPVTVGLYTMLNQGNTTPALYTLVVTGALLSILPLVVLFLTLQRYWRVDLLSGAVKG